MCQRADASSGRAAREGAGLTYLLVLTYLYLLASSGRAAQEGAGLTYLLTYLLRSSCSGGRWDEGTAGLSYLLVLTYLLTYLLRSSCSGGRWGKETCYADGRYPSWPGYPFADDSWSMEFHVDCDYNPWSGRTRELMLNVAIGERCPSRLKTGRALPIASSTGRRPWKPLSPSDECLANGRWLCVYGPSFYSTSWL